MQVREDCWRAEPDYDDAWVHACAAHARIVFDVGANVGYDALLILDSPGVEHIVLVDPNPAALALAAEHLIRNRLSAKARFVSGLVAAVAGETRSFWTVGAGAAGSVYRTHARTASRRQASLQVPTITIDSLCDTLGLVPDFIKVDVEGAESEVLGGAERCAQHGQTRWLVEMHSNLELPMRDNAARVLAWCASHGLTAWYLKQHTALRDPDDVAHRGRCHLLLQPAPWPYPEWLRGIPQKSVLPTSFP